MRVCLLIALLGLDIAPTTPATAEDAFVLIRNARNPVTNLTRAEIKDMAVGKKKIWPRGTVVQMVLGPVGSPELGWFSTVVVGAPEATFMAKVRQEVFKGEMRRPIIATEKDCLDAVAADPGGLGVIRAAAAAKLPPDVAVVSVR